MKKISPKDGMMYVTNLFLRFIANSPLQSMKKTTGEPVWTDQSLAKLLERKGYVKLVESPHGKAYTYTCIKSINQHELYELISVEDFYLNVKNNKDFSNSTHKKSS